jgi:predicted PurR-regulated permease PerM
MSSDVSSQSAESSNPYQWWYKPLIWAVFLTLLYLLREFFLIGFLTFLLCFVVRGLVGVLMHRFASDHSSHRLELALTLSSFAVICLGMYAVGRYFVPQVIHQGESLLGRIQGTSAADLQNNVLSNTVGTWRFRQQFGSPQDPRYQEGLKRFEESGRDGEGLYQTFPQLDSRLKSEFEANFEQAQTLHLKSDGLQGPARSAQFEQWFLTLKAPQLFDQRSDYYRSRWLAEFSLPEKSGDLASLKQRPDFESYQDQQIREQVLADIKSDPVLMAQFQNEWARARAVQKWADFRKSSEYQARFKEFYETWREQNPAAVPIGFSYFQTLAAAYPKGKNAFLAVARQHDKTDRESLAQQRHDFEVATKLELGQQWWGTSHVADWVRNHAKNDGDHLMEAVVGRVDRGLGHLVRIPVQIVTSLMLAIFILIDWHGLKQAVVSIRETRLQLIYDEIAPSVVALGKLIGKSFQGQVIIAMFNGVLTLVALYLIGVEYRFVLALVVFVFSFIPVVGVILSGVPICAVAVMQPGGTFTMALQVVMAIAVIHLVEGMVLSPRIIGKIGHLHPILVIVILLIAEHFFGMWGLILGVPVAIYLIRVVILNTAIPGIYEPRVVVALANPQERDNENENGT